MRKNTLKNMKMDKIFQILAALKKNIAADKDPLSISIKLHLVYKYLFVYKIRGHFFCYKQE
jgi:hypothetical protein